MSGSFTGAGGTCIGEYLGEIVVTPGSFVGHFDDGIIFWDTNSFAFIQTDDADLVWSFGCDPPDISPNTGKCAIEPGGPLSGIVNRQSPNNQTYHLFPTYYTIDSDPTHHAYGGALANYPTIGDLTRFSAGAASFDILFNASCVICLANLQGGAPFNTPGGLVSGSLDLTIPKNATIPGGGGLDPNSLPTIAVSASPCGTSGFTFSVISGSLPAGLSLNPATGAITGTPTVSGSYAFTVMAEKKSTSSYCWGTVDYSGVFIIADGGIEISGTNIDDTSGVYFFDNTLTHDILYSRFIGSTKDVKIPRPFAKTGYFGG